MHIGMTPLRISFAGGGTDMPEYYEKFGGHVVTTNINLFTYVIINKRHDDSFQTFSSDFEMHQSKVPYDELEPRFGTEIAVTSLKLLNFREGGDILICSDVKPGSGLGASSTLAVNFVNLISNLQGKNWTKNKIAETAYHIEREILNHSIGKQDDYIAAYGGFNYIDFTKDKISVSPIELKKSTYQELDNNLLLFFVGNTRNSVVVLSEQVKQIQTQNPKTIDALHTVKELSEELYSSLKRSDITKFGEILHKGWTSKKKFTTGVTNEKIDHVYDIALKNGAIGGKLTGAGGGGHLLLYSEKEKQSNLINKMNDLGLTHIPFNFHQSGPKILNLGDFSS